MAENESLDLSSADAIRWKRVCRDLSRGSPDEVVVRDVEKALLGGLRAAFKQMGARAGVTLADFLAADQSPEELKALVNRTRGHDYARLFQQVATDIEDKSAEGMTQGFVNAIWDKVQDQLGNHVVPSGGCASYPDLRARLRALDPQIDSIKDRLARRLTAKPSRLPPKPRPPRQEPSAKLAATLKESLL